MKLSFVISTQPTQFQAVAFDPNLEANIARLAELGYNGVELAVREPSKLDVAAIKKTLEKHKLQVPAIGTGQAYVEEHLSFTDPDASVREQAIARIKSHIELAVELGTENTGAGADAASSQTLRAPRNDSPPISNLQSPIVIIGLLRGTVQKNVAPEQAHAWLLDAMKELSSIAQEKNVRLAIEPLNRYETNLLNGVVDTLQLIEEIGAPNVGVLYDTFHANIEEPRIEIGMMVCRSRLFHVHIADSNRWYPGAGHTDFGRVVSTLRGMKYDGWVSAEILSKPDLATATERTIKNIKPLLGS